MFEKEQFYIKSPSGDLMLVEVFEEGNSISLLIGPTICLKMDHTSAFELAEALMVTANSTDLEQW